MNHLYWKLIPGFNEELTGGLRGWNGMALLKGGS